MAIILYVGFRPINCKTTLNRVWGGGLLFLFRGDGSGVQKLKINKTVSTVLFTVLGQYGSTPVGRTHMRLLSLD